MTSDVGHYPIDIQAFRQSFLKTVEDVMPYILERTKKIGHVSLGSIDYDIIQTDTDAAYSFIFGIFAATIFFASRAVEMAINKDARMQEEKMNYDWKWLSLSRRSLKEAQVRGLPVGPLLNPEEVGLDSDPVFVIRRNKVVHGDIEGYKEATGFYRVTDFTKPYKLPVAPSEDDAYDQFIKSRRFLIEWVKMGSTHVPKSARFVSWQDVT